METEPSSKLSGSKRKAEESETTAGPWRCELCDVSCTCETLLHEHLNGKKHKAKVELREIDGKGGFFCDLCNVECGRLEMFTTHCNGKKHKAREPKKVEGDDDEAESKEKLEVESFYCEICVVRCSGKETMSAHLIGKKHKAKERKKDEEDRGGRRIREEEKGFWCDVCKLSCTGRSVMAMHIVGRKHKVRAAMLGISEEKEGKDEKKETYANGEKIVEAEEEREEKNCFWCMICKVKCDSQAMIVKHLKGMEHKAKEALRRGKKMVEEKEAKEE